jgi:transposase InsO family protein
MAPLHFRAEAQEIIGVAYDHSHERATMLAKWQHHYNWHRPHAGIRGVPPMSRLKPRSHKSVFTLHS